MTVPLPNGFVIEAVKASVGAVFERYFTHF
jgi:hypothetical protein